MRHVTSITRIKTDFFEASITNGKPDFITVRNAGSVQLHFGTLSAEEFVRQFREILEHVD